ncbi:unnamed protein product [Nyctereutes procyonoides]|uniref:(raccoon dog) hypothetical protein n=1 Tax=Nyctereutes procyonoides TaxID=34880 RepID=A0A811ZYB0_NYCPR|nr:unnamed protein product [Nyctereutes procyonoides]
MGPGSNYLNILGKRRLSRVPAVSLMRDSIPGPWDHNLRADTQLKLDHVFHNNENCDDKTVSSWYQANLKHLGPESKTAMKHYWGSCQKDSGTHLNRFPPTEDGLISGVPGPGKYDIKSQFQKAESIPSVNDASPAFLSQSQRFVPMKSITPAPGTYNESRTAFNSLKKTPGLKSTPFGQSAARFTQDCRTEEMPGPGFYNTLNNTIIDNVSNTCLKKQKKSAFGSSVPRTLFLVKKEAFSAPGPADYQVGISDELPDLTNYYAAFLSRTQRSTKLSDMDNPAPGSYNVQKSYEMSQVQHKYMAPRSFVAKLKHASFLSTTPRCLEKMTDGPGPATYDPVLKKSCSIPLFVKASKRFKDSKEITPGPATYEVYMRHSIVFWNLKLTVIILLKLEYFQNYIEETSVNLIVKSSFKYTEKIKYTSLLKSKFY